MMVWTRNSRLTTADPPSEDEITSIPLGNCYNTSLGSNIPHSLSLPEKTTSMQLSCDPEIAGSSIKNNSTKSEFGGNQPLDDIFPHQSKSPNRSFMFNRISRFESDLACSEVPFGDIDHYWRKVFTESFTLIERQSQFEQ